MEKRGKEPLFLMRSAKLLLEIIILGLIAVRLLVQQYAPVCEIGIFLLAAVDNFIGATGYFFWKKRVRGNICAVLCAVFLLVGIFWILRYVDAL